MCLSPVTIRRRIAGRDYLNNVPCNKCLECVKDKQNEYIVRSIEEFRKKPMMTFFTLTYSPEALPMNDFEIIDEESGEISFNEVQTLRRSDVSHWLKMFKQRMKRKGLTPDFSYMIKGEYGPKTQRPHYHGLIFGLDEEQVNDLMWTWKTRYGFVCFKKIPSLMSHVEKVSRYCAKYMIKNEDWNLVPVGAEKPRVMSSQFYGMPDEKRWKGMVLYHQAQDFIPYDPLNPKFENVQDMYRLVQEIIKRRYYDDGNGKRYKLPNYYKRKIFYYKDEGHVRASAIQRMVTYNVQRDFDKNFKEELHNLASLYQIGDYAKAIDKLNLIHDDDKRRRAYRYAESDRKYMLKSVC